MVQGYCYLRFKLFFSFLFRFPPLPFSLNLSLPVQMLPRELFRAQV